MARQPIPTNITNEHVGKGLFNLPRRDTLRYYQKHTSADGKTIYFRYHPGDKSGKNLIVKLTTVDVQGGGSIETQECTYDVWDNREAIQTWYPINGNLDIRDITTRFEP